MAFAPSASIEDSPSQAFLSNNNDDDSDFAALDSMTPHAYNASQHYGQQQPQQQTSQHFGAVVPHSLYNNQGTSGSGASAHGSMNSGGTGDNNIGRVGDGVNGGFSGVSESLFDRIRARAEQQQKPQQSSYPSSAVQPSQQQQPQPQQQVKSAFVSQQQQQPTMEYERDPSVGGAFAHNTGNIPNPSTNEATYTFSPPPSGLPSQNSQQYPQQQQQQQQQQPPHVPTYGPSRNDPHYSSHAGSHNHGHGGPMTSFQDKAAMAWEQTSSTFKSLWEKASSGAQTIGALAREARAGNGGSGGMRGAGGGYNNNFLLRSEIDDDDEMERGVGSGPNASQLRQQHHQQRGATTDTVMGGSNASSAGSGAVVGDQAYSMVTYAKTFCLDVFGFVKDMPLWGKGFFVLVLLWAFYAFKG